MKNDYHEIRFSPKTKHFSEEKVTQVLSKLVDVIMELETEQVKDLLTGLLRKGEVKPIGFTLAVYVVKKNQPGDAIIAVTYGRASKRMVEKLAQYVKQLSTERPK